MSESVGGGNGGGNGGGSGGGGEGSGTLVTLGMPTYNRADAMLGAALERALGQTHERLEIIVADNCSADRTSELVASFDDPRIRYVRHATNIGANANFNFCVEEASGDYFLLFHDDDLIDEDFVASGLAAAAAHRDAHGDWPSVVRTGTRIIDGDGAPLYEEPNRSRAATLAALLDDWYAGTTAFYLCSTLYRTDLLRASGGFGSPRNLLQDVVAWLRVSARGSWADIAPCKAAFRHHDGEMTGAAKIEHWCEDSLFLLEEIARLSGRSGEELAGTRRFLAEMAYRRCREAGSLGARLRAERHVADALSQPRDSFGRLGRELLGKLRRRLAPSG